MASSCFINVSSLLILFPSRQRGPQIMLSTILIYTQRGRQKTESFERIDNLLPRGEWKSAHVNTSCAHSKLDIDISFIFGCRMLLAFLPNLDLSLACFNAAGKSLLLPGLCLVPPCVNVMRC